MEIEVSNEGQAADSQRRTMPRIRLQVPVFVRGNDSSGVEFIELTKTVNISSTGACIACTRLLRSEQLVYLTIPTPSPVTTVVPSETAPIAARVLRRQDLDGEVRLFGLEFLRPLE